MSQYSQNLELAKKKLGGFEAIGVVCGVTGKAVRKWHKNGRPPRTEYTGETKYAELISNAMGRELDPGAFRPSVAENRCDPYA